MSLFEPVLAALDTSGARYVVVGGVAVVLHGHPRLTADLDLVVDLVPEQATKAIRALLGIGLVPLLPVDALDFADPRTRQSWVTDRNLKVFTLRDRGDGLRQVDLLAEDPVPFEGLWSRASEVRIGALRVRVASVDDLIAMKRVAGRPQDVADIEALERIRRQRPPQ